MSKTYTNQTQRNEWDNRFTFSVGHRTLVEGEWKETEIISRQFASFYHDPEFLLNDPVSSSPNSREEGVFTNSVAAINLGNEVITLLRQVLKKSAVDYLWNSYKPYHRRGAEAKNLHKDAGEYYVRIIDRKAPLYTDEKTTNVITGVPQYDMLKSGTRSNVILETSFRDSDYIPYYGEYLPDFWKVWKDFIFVMDFDQEVRIISTILNPDVNRGFKKQILDTAYSTVRIRRHFGWVIEALKNGYKSVDDGRIANGWTSIEDLQSHTTNNEEYKEYLDDIVYALQTSDPLPYEEISIDEGDDILTVEQGIRSWVKHYFNESEYENRFLSSNYTAYNSYTHNTCMI